MPALCIQDQLQEMAKLRSVLAEGTAIAYFRNGLRISYRRIVVGTVNDDQVERRDHEKIVRSRTPRRIDTRKGNFGKVHAAVVDPPEVFVSAKTHPIGRDHFAGMTTFLDPGLGH